MQSSMRAVIVLGASVALSLAACTGGERTSDTASANFPLQSPSVDRSAIRPFNRDSTLASARTAIANYLQSNLVEARGDVAMLDLCYQVPTFKDAGSLLAVARARILDVQLAPNTHGPEPDSVSVLAELLVVARAPFDSAQWVVEQHVELDTLRLTLIPSTHRRDLVWGLCWAGYTGSGFRGAPGFLRITDSAFADVHWKPPATSWAWLAEVTDSVRWSNLQPLSRDSAVARAVRTGSWNDRLGVLQFTRDGHWCLTIADSTLPPGTPLLVVPPQTPDEIATGSIEGRRADACTTPGDEWGSVSGEPGSFYDVVLSPGQSAAVPSIVIAARPGAFRRNARGVSIDIDGDGRPEHFARCASHEGLHLTVTTGTGASAVERWHRYFYVPYDLEPDCK